MESKIGARVRGYREKRGLSRQELAQRAGLTEATVAALEDGGPTPSIGPLIRAARALGLRLGTLLDDVQGPDPLIVRASAHAAERQADVVTHLPSGPRESMTFFSLGKGKADRVMEPFLITVQPDGDALKALSTHEGEEFIHVLTGSVEVRYGNEHHVLSAGDSIYLNSVVPHWVGCGGEQPATLLAVLHVPS